MIPRAIVPMRVGEAPLSGHTLESAANLNLYRGWQWCVGWHCEDEPLFGKCGDAMLIVPVSLGSSVLFRWRRQSCPDDEGHFIPLGHGDILVMDGQCQDEFLHRTDPGREQERINIAFRWVKQHVSSCPLFKAGVACCLPKCAHGSSVPVMENVFLVFFCFFLVSSWRFVHVGSTSLAGLPVVHKTWVTQVCLLLDTPFGRRSMGHYLCNLLGENLKIHKTAFQRFGIHVGLIIWKPFLLALAGQPSLHGFDA